jgi:hypothetical protein
VILVVFALAIGILMTGLIFRYTTRIQGLAWSFAGLLMPVSCVFYPIKAARMPARDRLDAANCPFSNTPPEIRLRGGEKPRPAGQVGVRQRPIVFDTKR